MSLDQRASDALNIFYGNRSFLGTMRGPWIKYGATHAFMYGEPLQVFLSALGLVDIVRNPQYGPFPYPVEVALPLVNAASLKGARNWGGLIENWFSIQRLASLTPMPDDLLIVVDVTAQSEDSIQKRATSMMHRAIQSHANILVMTRPDQELPATILSFRGNFTGSQHDNLLPFMLAHLDASVASKRPGRIFITGDDSERVVTTALSALDHLVRHHGGKQFFNVLSNRVIVDTSVPVWVRPVQDYADACAQLGIPVCTQLPSGVRIEPEHQKVLIHPIG